MSKTWLLLTFLFLNVKASFDAGVFCSASRSNGVILSGSENEVKNGALTVDQNGTLTVTIFEVSAPVVKLHGRILKPEEAPPSVVVTKTMVGGWLAAAGG